MDDRQIYKKWNHYRRPDELREWFISCSVSISLQHLTNLSLKLTLLTLFWGLVLRFSGFSQHLVDRLRMAVAAMWAASASWE